MQMKQVQESAEEYYTQGADTQCSRYLQGGDCCESAAPIQGTLIRLGIPRNGENGPGKLAGLLPGRVQTGFGGGRGRRKPGDRNKSR